MLFISCYSQTYTGRRLRSKFTEPLHHLSFGVIGLDTSIVTQLEVTFLIYSSFLARTKSCLMSQTGYCPPRKSNRKCFKYGSHKKKRGKKKFRIPIHRKVQVDKYLNLIVTIQNNIYSPVARKTIQYITVYINCLRCYKSFEYR